VRIHLGHHFYGAGNLGDDFMLAGFLAAMRTLAPEATFSCCVPFALAPLQARFPAIEWLPYESATRERCTQACDLWLGLGGSPFQSAQSRWFVDHLAAEAAACARERKPMYFLGVGVQTGSELLVPEISRICAGAAGIWTRDDRTAERLRALPSSPAIESGADLAHVFFRDVSPPPAAPGRVTAVLNFDFEESPRAAAGVATLRAPGAGDYAWLAQDSRALPGAERTLHARLAPAEQARWRLVVPDVPGEPLSSALARWPSGEWLLTARYHAAIAGAWAGSKIVVIGINEKLEAVARELQAPLVGPDADTAAVERALRSATPAQPPRELAERAFAACAAFLRSAVAPLR
jgi:hypothetical protein